MRQKVSFLSEQLISQDNIGDDKQYEQYHSAYDEQQIAGFYWFK